MQGALQSAQGHLHALEDVLRVESLLVLLEDGSVEGGPVPDLVITVQADAAQEDEDVGLQVIGLLGYWMQVGAAFSFSFLTPPNFFPQGVTYVVT